MMKKYFSNIFALAALLMAGAAFTACSSEDNSIEQPANPVGEKTYTLTINASKGVNASTRALALDGAKLVASWADGDELSVFKATSPTECTAGNLLGTISTVASAISADGDQATFTGTLSGTVSDGDKLMLVYHPAAFAITGFSSQAGTLASASNLDCATAQVTASVSGSDITISETSATFTTQTAMLKLTLTDGTNKLNATQLKILATMTILGNPMTVEIATFNLAAATYTANGAGILYFALPDQATVAAALYANIIKTYPALATSLKVTDVSTALVGATLTYDATVGSDTYTATKTGYTFAAGKYYAGTLAMVPLTDLSKLTGAYTAKNGETLTGTTDKQISIEAGATVTLKNVNISVSSFCIKCEGDATIILADGSTNTLNSTNNDYPALWAGDAGTTLTIQGSTGELNVSSGDYCAGIGGGYSNTYRTCGNIMIVGGIITASGGDLAAGIGADCCPATCGNITITGGTVKATGGYSAPGIGGGSGETDTNKCGDITIASTVTKVTATKGENAPYSIGQGIGGTCGTITFGSAQVFNGTAWSPSPMVAGTYGGLTLAISTKTEANDTWTLTPAP